MPEINRRSILKYTGAAGAGAVSGMIGTAGASSSITEKPVGSVFFTEAYLHFDVKSNIDKQRFVTSQGDPGNSITVNDGQVNFYALSESEKSLVRSKSELLYHEGLSSMGGQVQFRSNRIPLNAPSTSTNMAATPLEPVDVSGTISKKNGKVLAKFSNKKKLVNNGKTKRIKLNQRKQKIKAATESGKVNIHMVPVVTITNHGSLDATIYEVNNE